MILNVVSIVKQDELFNVRTNISAAIFSSFLFNNGLFVAAAVSD
jgi:hypothetical protein